MTTTTDASNNETGGSDATTGTTGTTETFQVAGMTCDHCARAVTSELMGIAGVTEVNVDVPTGQVTVSSTAPLTSTDVRAAIDEAGYQLA